MGGVTVSALYVQRGGVYWDVPGVDPWDEERDARLYTGPNPVVAHPPCQRWGRCWYGGPMLHKAGRRLVLGDDAGCFSAAAIPATIPRPRPRVWNSRRCATMGRRTGPQSGDVRTAMTQGQTSRHP